MRAARTDALAPAVGGPSWVLVGKLRAVSHSRTKSSSSAVVMNLTNSRTCANVPPRTSITPSLRQATGHRNPISQANREDVAAVGVARRRPGTCEFGTC